MTLEYGDIPRYRQLAAILRRQIETGEIPPRTPIPPKRDLRDRYGVSGETVNKAVGILRDAGLVRTVPGLGIFVTAREEWPA
jgi:DNA-binding GntR family transcriptional regulator